MKDNHHVVFKNKTKCQKPYLVFLFNLEVIGRFEISSKLIFIFIMSPEHCRQYLLAFSESTVSPQNWSLA